MSLCSDDDEYQTHGQSRLVKLERTIPLDFGDTSQVVPYMIHALHLVGGAPLVL